MVDVPQETLFYDFNFVLFPSYRNIPTRSPMLALYEVFYTDLCDILELLFFLQFFFMNLNCFGIFE